MKGLVEERLVALRPDLRPSGLRARHQDRHEGLPRKLLRRPALHRLHQQLRAAADRHVPIEEGGRLPGVHGALRGPVELREQADDPDELLRRSHAERLEGDLLARRADDQAVGRQPLRGAARPRGQRAPVHRL